MISNLKAYPTTKVSGIEWLEDIPAHWQVRQLKTLCSESALYGANIPATSYVTAGVRFLRTTDITEDGQLERRGVFLPLELVRDYQLVDGDLLFSRSGTVGRSFLYDRKKHGPCSYAGYLVRFVPGPNVRPRFIYWFSKSLAFTGFLKAMTISSTIENVNGAKYAACPLPLPLLSEQSAITRYLDYLDRRVQRYIRAKEKLIALLEEYKQALIHQAVTGQIDVRTGEPYEEYKESEVEWLGKLPEHWDPKRARFVLKEVDVRSMSGEEMPLSMSQALGLVPSHMVERTLTAASKVGGKLCEKGDLVLNRLKAHLGVFALSAQPGIVSPDYSVFRARASDHMEYFERVFRLPAMRTELRIRAKGIVEGFWRLYTDDLFDITLPVPSLCEQQVIAEYVSETISRFQTVAAYSRNQIDSLNEYRTRLIADVVTGKLDVREAAAALPEVDPPEAHESIGVTPHENQKLELDTAAAVAQAAAA